MSSDAAADVAIRVEGVSKVYLIYARPQDRLRQAVVPRLQRLLGRADAARETRYFREFWALRDVSFEIPKGSTVGIVGRNGSGKSTLLQIVCGTLQPTFGNVTVNGRVAALLELGSGFNPEFTGRENVYLNASILGLTREQIAARFDDIVAFSEIGDFIDQPVKTYSSGMTLRLAFAVIAHVDADILVIDEALAVGDAFFTQKCMRFLRRFMKTGTILFVSHDTAAVTSLCDSAIWLENGVKRLQDNARRVSDAYLEALVEARQGKSPEREPPPGPAPRPPEPGADGDPGADGILGIGGGQGSGSTSGPSRTGSQMVPEADPRLPLLNASVHRNELQLFEFDPQGEGFGSGGGRIVDVRFHAGDGQPVLSLTGGEIVTLLIEIEALEAMERPIVGFILRNRLGQAIFGDNTFLSTRDSPVRLAAGRRLVARFRFRMPILPVGDYSIAAALADGTQDDHTQHHWLHEALIFKSTTSSVTHGVIGLPMQSIELLAPDQLMR